jgi:NADH-quinone oxidoreductase subunit E
MDRTQTARVVDVVVIDDEESIREGCRQALESEGYLALVANDGAQGIRMVEETRPKLVLLDLRMPSVGGIDVLERLPRIDPRIVPIVITGYGTVDSAVTSMKLGAFDFIAKPFDMDQLLEVVTRGMARHAEAPQPSKPALKLVPPPRELTEADVLLRGLEVLGQFYALGLGGDTLSNRLRALEEEARHHAGHLGRIREEEKVLTDLVKDLKLVDEVIEKHEFKKNALIQIMLEIQSRKRWLPRHVNMWISRRLNVPLARIYSIASFYEAFSLVPQGEHTVQVCTGTACHVRKSDGLLSMVSTILGIEPGQTDPDMRYTLKTVNCLGCCALAPVMKVDDRYYGNPSLSDLRAVFESTKNEETSCKS